jgi:hypothetical protein
VTIPIQGRKAVIMAAKKTAAAEKTATVAVDPDVYVGPTGIADGFTGDGSVSLDRQLNRRALGNITELARTSPTQQGREHWNGVLRRDGVLGEGLSLSN